MTVSLWKTPRGLLPPIQLPLNNFPLGNYRPDNFPHEIPSRTVTPRTFAHPPSDNYPCMIPPRQLPPNNYPREYPVYINNRNTKE